MVQKTVFFLLALCSLVMSASIDPRVKRQSLRDNWNRRNDHMSEREENRHTTSTDSRVLGSEANRSDNSEVVLNDQIESNGQRGSDRQRGSERQTGSNGQISSDSQTGTDGQRVSDNQRGSDRSRSPMESISGSDGRDIGSFMGNGSGGASGITNAAQNMGSRVPNAFMNTMRDEKDSIGNSWNSMRQLMKQGVDTKMNFAKTKFDMGTAPIKMIQHLRSE